MNTYEVALDSRLLEPIQRFLDDNPSTDFDTIINRALAYYLVAQGYDEAGLVLVLHYPQKEAA